MNISKHFLLYLFFGIATTAVNWMIYIFFTGVIDVELTVANSLAWTGAVVFAFLTNKKYVFKSKETCFKVMIKQASAFLFSRAFSGLFEIFLPTFLFRVGLKQSLFNIEGFWAKALVSIIVVVFNYVLSKKFVFGIKEKEYGK